MDEVDALKSKYLTAKCDPKKLPCKTTSDLKTKTYFIGQKRAYEAIHFGIKINHFGYNLYALGPDNIGKLDIVETILKQAASHQSTPSDWCYIYNFKNPRCPWALELPAGVGLQLKKSMDNLVSSLTETLLSLFETIEHQARIKTMDEEVTAKQKKYFDSLRREAEKHDMTILSTSKGFVVVPIRGDQVLTEKELQSLSFRERRANDELTEELNEQLASVIGKIQRLHKIKRKQEREYERELALKGTKPAINRLRKKFKNLPQVLEYLDDVQEDVINNVKAFIKEEEPPPQVMFGETHPLEFLFSRYSINVIVNNEKTKGAPVIYEENPRHYKILGRIEHVSQLGALVTDFSLIQGGALHRANGGYLIINVEKILEHGSSWEALKRALLTQEIKIELPPSLISVTSTSILEPEPIPLDIKVILLGEREDYYELRDTDPEFNELFKVSVDFEETINRNEDTLDLYARLIATAVHKKSLRPFDAGAIARIIDHGSRLIADAEKLSLHLHELNNLLEEADHWAEEAGNKVVTKREVQKAIDFQKFRLDHYQQLLYEDILRQILFINTEGERIAQINALTTYRLGDFTFGTPSRITATTRIGREGIIDIEREVNLSGPIHAKGVLILSGYIKNRYAHGWPLSLSASVVFEQSYGSVDGDSASVAELCTLLSSLSKVPIKQSLAVTGSVNQHGMVQAIGCVNEKIEGFFDICKERGLTGEQGVVIPKANVKNLMLREDVIAAARKNLFHIYPIETMEQAILILLGKPAGQRGKDGNFPKNTVNYLVEHQLEEYAKIQKKWTRDTI